MWSQKSNLSEHLQRIWRPPRIISFIRLMLKTQKPGTEGMFIKKFPPKSREAVPFKKKVIPEEERDGKILYRNGKMKKIGER